MNRRLEAREAAAGPVRVGIIGAGRFGTMVICQLAGIRGMRPAVVSDISGEQGLRALAHAGYAPAAVVRTDSIEQVNQAIARGLPVFTEDPQVLLRSDVDVVVEATGVPEAGAASALDGLRNGKHVVMVCTNVACMLKGGYDVLRALEAAAGCKAGETSPDGELTIVEEECLAACADAPMMISGHKYFLRLTPETAARALDEIKKLPPDHGHA